MTSISDKSGSKNIVIFGAGKIGRSFIGQLFSQNGYNLIFIDNNEKLVAELNRRKVFRIIVRANPDYTIKVKNFCAILVSDRISVAEALVNADIAATSVGKNAFRDVIEVVTEGLNARYRKFPDRPLDIILGENIIDASQVAAAIINNHSGRLFGVKNYVGLVETSIGKMVPILPHKLESEDPLVLFAEKYNTLILDKKGFLNPAPDFPGLQLVNNIEAWVYRKALIHNLGHAAVAYYGFYCSPKSRYISDLLEIPEVEIFARKVMKASATILYQIFPEDFKSPELDQHIDELLNRFENKALGDSVFRVGCDLYRKFGINDRIFGAITMARKYDFPLDLFCQVAAYGLYFRATDEDGNYFQNDNFAVEEINSEPKLFLTRLSGLSEDDEIIRQIMKYYKEFSKKPVSNNL